MYGLSPSASLFILPVWLLPAQHLNPNDFLHDPNVVRLLINHLFQILEAVRQILDLPLVEVGRIFCILFHEEPSSNVNKDVGRIGEAAGDVERRSQRQEERLGQCGGVHAIGD